MNLIAPEAQRNLLQPAETYELSDVISAMSYALDITEGQPEGHATKSCLIAMRIAEEIDLPAEQRSSLFYGTLLKDAGCSSNAAKVCSLFGADDIEIKRSFKLQDLTSKVSALSYMIRNVASNQPLMQRAAKLVSAIGQPNAGTELIQTRCSRGADIATKLGFDEDTAAVVRGLDEHWDGNGEPYGHAGDEIPLNARIACLAQTVEVFFRTYGLVPALEVARQRSGKWFDPTLVQALESVSSDLVFWETLDQADVRSALASRAPKENKISLDEDRLDAIAEGFADVIDAKSPWTSRHSYGVADAMIGILQEFGYDEESYRYWRRAALLHDIGKLGVSNQILDKPGRLTDEEFESVKRHVDYTRSILKHVPCFASFADDAAAHHEKLDGSGYGLGLTAEQLSREAKAMCVADIFDALSAKRPYREGQLSLDEVFDIMRHDAGTKICAESFEALQSHLQKHTS